MWKFWTHISGNAIPGGSNSSMRINNHSRSVHTSYIHTYNLEKCVARPSLRCRSSSSQCAFLRHKTQTYICICFCLRSVTMQNLTTQIMRDMDMVNIQTRDDDDEFVDLLRHWLRKKTKYLVCLIKHILIHINNKKNLNILFLLDIFRSNFNIYIHIQIEVQYTKAI